MFGDGVLFLENQSAQARAGFVYICQRRQRQHGAWICWEVESILCSYYSIIGSGTAIYALDFIKYLLCIRRVPFYIADMKNYGQ